MTTVFENLLHQHVLIAVYNFFVINSADGQFITSGV